MLYRHVTNTYRIQKDRVIVVPVKLSGPNGEKWMQAIFDTGATYSMFPPAVIRAIGCYPTQIEKTVKIITSSSVEYVPMLTIPRLELFNRSLENIVVVSHLLPPSTPAQGLIGISTLNRFDYELNFSLSELVIKK